MDKKFTKRVESFSCQICGSKVRGKGYTDHCPNCLFSKHVDIFPGDRQANCGGLMEPVGIAKKKGRWQIFYRCQKCGQQRRNKLSAADNQEKISELSKKPIPIQFLP